MSFSLPASVRKQLHGAIFLSGVRGANLVSRVLYLLVVTRMLGPDLYGLLAFAQSWYLLFLPLAGLGLDPLVAREVGRLGRDRASDMVGRIYRLTLLSSLVGMLTCAVLAWLVEADRDMAWTMTVFSLALLFRSLYFRAEMLFVAHEQIRAIVPVAVLVRPLEPLLALLLLWQGGGILQLALLHAFTWGLQASVVTYLAGRAGFLPGLGGLGGQVLSLVGHAVPLLLSALAATQLNQGPIMLYRWLDGPELGQLSLLVQAALVLGILPRSIQMTLLPAVSRRTAKDPEQAADIGRFLVASSLLAGGALALLAKPLAPWLLVPILGEDYRPALEAVWLSLLLVGLMSAGQSLNQQLIARGRYWTMVLVLTIGVSCQVGGFLLLDPQSPETALLVGGIGGVFWVVSGALSAGLAGTLWRALSVLAVGLGIAQVMPNPWLGMAVGLGTLGFLAGWAKVVVIPKTGSG